MTPVYRNAEATDAAALDRLFRKVFCDTFAHLYRDEDLAAFLSGFDAGKWQALVASEAYAFRIAEVEGVPAGYVKLGPMNLPIEPNKPAILLEQLYVLKEYHGAGIAAGLMEWAVEEARSRNAEELYLTVFIDNHRARRFYDRYSFVPVGRYEFMVGSHADEDVIMKKVL